MLLFYKHINQSRREQHYYSRANGSEKHGSERDFVRYVE